MACKCGCGMIKSQPRFVFKMNLLRVYVGYAIRLNSWWRCLIHNLSVGGLVTSSHPEGWASDLDTPTNLMKYRILLAAGKIGFRGIGVGRNFIHLDDDDSKADNRFWIY